MGLRYPRQMRIVLRMDGLMIQMLQSPDSLALLEPHLFCEVCVVCFGFAQRAMGPVTGTDIAAFRSSLGLAQGAEVQYFATLPRCAFGNEKAGARPRTRSSTVLPQDSLV